MLHRRLSTTTRSSRVNLAARGLSALGLGGLLCLVSGCSVLAVADAAVTVAATAVSVTATVVETTVDVAAAGVRAVTPDDKPKEQVQDQTDQGAHEGANEGANHQRTDQPERPIGPSPSQP